MTTFDPTVIDQARAIPLATFRPIPDGFGTRAPQATSPFRSATMPAAGGQWVVCRAPTIPSTFRLLDATVRQLLEHPSAGAVAILEARPAKEGPGPVPQNDYLRRFQQVVWSAFGVAWVLDGDERFLAKPTQATVRADRFEELAGLIEAELARCPLTKAPEGSRKAEQLVRPIVQRALGNAFTKVSSRYRGLWRWPSADGIWENTDGRSIALEVKLGEDLTCPLCQVAETLGRVDGVVQVRVGAAKLPNTPAAMLATTARKLLQERAPVRFLELKVKP